MQIYQAGKLLWFGLCVAVLQGCSGGGTSDAVSDTPEDQIPTLTLTGDESVIVVAGSHYEDEGATAYDLQDGDLSGKIDISGSIDTRYRGTYQLTYSVTDSDGNVAPKVTRTVTVLPLEGNAFYDENASLNTINPHRGFYDADYALDRDQNYDPYETAYDDGYRMVYASIFLGDYNETDTLPDDLLTTVNDNLAKAKDAHLGIVLRIKYRNETDSSDPAKEIILSHLDQLKPILQQYPNTISVVQAGMIGAWGEWHSFTDDFSDETVGYLENRKEVLTRLSDIFPSTFIQIRTPMHKEQLFGETGVYTDEGTAGMITPETAYSTTLLSSRIGHHNDCFLSNATDMGTYLSDNIDFWKQYVANDGMFAPVGGETCAIGDGDDALLSDCDNARREMRRLHFAFLNDSYHPDVLQKWKDQGCYEEIGQDLGYRFAMESLQYAYDAASFDVNMTLTNHGYASPYRAAPLSLVLQNESHTYRFDVDTDIRNWKSDVTQQISNVLPLENVEAGRYCLYFAIDDPLQPIALANASTWDSTLQMNRLGCDIEIFK